MNKQEIPFSPTLVEPLFKSLRIHYNIFLMSLILITLFLSRGFLTLPAASEEVSIQIQSFSVLITLGLIPFALWLFGKQRKALLELPEWATREKKYKNISLIRLALLWTVIISNIVFYFITGSYSELLCSGMGVTASIFCIPSVKKIQDDLFEEEDEDSISEEE